MIFQNTQHAINYHRKCIANINLAIEKLERERSIHKQTISDLEVKENE